MDETLAWYEAYIPRCILCGKKLGADEPVKTFGCRHPICDACYHVNFLQNPAMIICPLDGVASQQIVEIRELSELLYTVRNTENVQEEVLIQVIEKMRQEINHNSPCLDQNCHRGYCALQHDVEIKPNPLDLLRNGSMEPPAAVNSDYSFPRRPPQDVSLVGFYERVNPVQPELERGEIGIASESLWVELTAGNPAPLLVLCGKYSVSISSCNHFNGKVKSSVRWAYGSLSQPRYFSNEESFGLEVAMEQRAPACQCAIGKVLMRPLVLIVEDVAYAPVFRLVSFASDPHFAQLELTSRQRGLVEAFNREVQALEVQQIVEKNVDGEAVRKIAQTYRLHLSDSDRHFCLRGTLADVKSAMADIYKAPKIDQITHFVINGELTRRLAEQLGVKKHFIVMNNLIIGEKNVVYQSLLTADEFDNALLQLNLPPEILRKYHIQLQGNKLIGSIEDIAEAAAFYAAEKNIVDGLSEAEPRVLKLAGRMVEAQLLPPEDRFAPWYFLQKAETEVTEIAQGSQEYAKIVKGLRDTGCLNMVLKVEEVRCKPLYLRYLKKLYELEQEVGKTPHVQELYHGPRIYSPTDMLVSKDGFERRAGMGSWGIGFYFSVRAPKAVHYAFRVPEAPKHIVILLCDVIVGESIHLKSDTRLRAPPDGCQSVFGKGRGSNMYIVYKPNMIHMKYIITLEAND